MVAAVSQQQNHRLRLAKHKRQHAGFFDEEFGALGGFGLVFPNVLLYIQTQSSESTQYRGISQPERDSAFMRDVENGHDTHNDRRDYSQSSRDLNNNVHRVFPYLLTFVLGYGTGALITLFGIIHSANKRHAAAKKFASIPSSCAD
jgi:hypothetical protein